MPGRLCPHKLASLLLVIGLAVLPSILKAQAVSGDVVGTVIDASGAVVPNASMVARNTATGITYPSVTNGQGEYRINNLPPGTYDVSASAPGFETTALKGLSVQLNVTATANLTLRVGQVSSAVDVTAAAAAIDTTTAQVQSTYNTRDAADLPNVSSGAGVLNLSLLQAGVSSNSGIGLGYGPSVGGQRPTNNNFMIDGGDNNSKYTPGPQIVVPNDSVAEFTLLQNQFQAEFGHSSGGQFNTIVKSGTNEFHGMIYDYLMNRDLDALDTVFARQGYTSPPRYDNNRLGANFGGPIKRNKLFFFVSYEYNPIGQASTSGVTVYAPTAASYATLAGLPGVNQNNLNVLKQYATAPAVSRGAPLVTVDGVSVPTGILPITGPNYANHYYGVSSVDYNISEKDQLRGRFLYNSTDQLLSSAQLPAFYSIAPTRDYLTTLSEYHTFTPTLVNELRLDYHRSNSSEPAPKNTFPGLDAFPELQFNDLNLEVGPVGVPSSLVLNVYQAVDNITWTHGTHTFTFGSEFRKYIEPDYAISRPLGNYQYSTVANYLLDLVPDYLAQRGLGGLRYYGDQIATYDYVQDTWRARPNLTFDLGLRYEYTTVPYSQRLQSLNAIANDPGLITFPTPTAPKKDFAPRVGVAYSPGTSGTTSIRAGFGIAYDVVFDSLGALSLPPELSTTITLTGEPGGNFLANGAIPANYGGALNPTFTVAQARALTASVITNLIPPYAINWTADVEHVFAKNYTLEVRYLGDRGVHLPIQNEYNRISDVTPANSIPTYFAPPSLATLASLPLTVGQLRSVSNLAPAYAAAGFTDSIIGVVPAGESLYNGLAVQMRRRFDNGLQFIGAYTWSHNLDDSSIELFNTYLSPRRPENFNNIKSDWSNSQLDHRQRFTFTAVYDLPFYKSSTNWWLHNVVGNWEVAPIYTFESGEPYTPQSAIDSNLNGDTAGDRTVVNLNGVPGTGTSVYGLTATGVVVPVSGPKAQVNNVVAWVATNPNAQYVEAGYGAWANAGRNTATTEPIDDVDLTLLKRFSLTERWHLELMGEARNVFNHPQYIPGSIDDVASLNTTGANVLAYVNVASPVFGNASQAFSSNPRTIVASLKLIF